jgi:TonB family protein
MKRCPRCDRAYPDSEKFCDADGTALVAGGPAFVEGGRSDSGAAGSEGAVECPTCGGRAEPGEVICNFCGTRLAPEGSSPSAPPRPPQEPSMGRVGTRVTGEPPQRTSPQFTGRIPSEQTEEENSGGGFLTTIVYVLAALAALGGGAWLAIHLSSHKAATQQAKASPTAVVSPAAAASPAPLVSSAPAVALAATMAVQVTGESASAPERSVAVATSIFDGKKSSLLDAYNHALAGDSSMKDGMLVRLRVLPDGSVAEASVVTSTAPNPGLDAEVVKDVSGWKFANFSGTQVEVDYPVIFSHNPAEQAAAEADLRTKVAALSPNESPEYAASPAAPPTPAIAEKPAPPVAEATPHAHRRPRREVARPLPTPSLYDRVADALKGSPKLRRVKAYTNPDGTVTLVGRVFDDNDKMLAERTAKRVSGVTGVVDTLTTDTSIWAEQQAKIQQQLANAGLDKVTVKVIGKDAFLNGEVKTELEKQRAVTIAEGAAPVVVRENLIRVVPGNMFGF